MTSPRSLMRSYLALGWSVTEAERETIECVCRAQPDDTRLDSFGIFPSRSPAIRLAIMGFKSRQEVCSFLVRSGWPGRISAVGSVIERFMERANIVRTGVNIDVQEKGIGPVLGLTLIVKQRYTKDSRYWLDGLTDWDPFLEALGPRGHSRSGKAQLSRQLGFGTDNAFREVWSFRPTARNSPHQAGHIRRQTPKS